MFSFWAFFVLQSLLIKIIALSLQQD